MPIRVFISHRWDSTYDNYGLMFNLLRQADIRYRLDFVDESIPKERRLAGHYDSVEPEIFDKIDTCHVVLIVNSIEEFESIPVRRELERARQLGKPIVALAPPPAHTQRIRIANLAEWGATPCTWHVASLASKLRSLTQKTSHTRSDTVLDEAGRKLGGASVREALVTSVAEIGTRGRLVRRNSVERMLEALRMGRTTSLEVRSGCLDQNHRATRTFSSGVADKQ